MILQWAVIRSKMKYTLLPEVHFFKILQKSCFEPFFFFMCVCVGFSSKAFVKEMKYLVKKKKWGGGIWKQVFLTLKRILGKVFFIKSSLL